MTRTLILATALAFAVACAHKPKPPTEEVIGAPTAKAEPAPAPVVQTPVAETTQTPTEDIEALLAGAILHFEFDSATLSAENQARLDRVASALKKNAGIKVR